MTRGSVYEVEVWSHEGWRPLLKTTVRSDVRAVLSHQGKLGREGDDIRVFKDNKQVGPEEFE